MERLKATIEGIPPSPETWGKGRSFWVYTKLRNKWFVLLMKAIGFADPKCRYIKITMYRNRLLDRYDNLNTSCKFIIDCLKEWIDIPSKRKPFGKKGLGWISDDTGLECTIEIQQIKVNHRKDQKTEIEIEDLEKSA